jgi:ABC-type dipeptide/oligopeptide/nickel transport system permease subunit
MRLSIPASASAKSKSRAGRSAWALTLEQFLRRPLALVGLGMLLVLILAAVFAPYIAPYDPIRRNFAERFVPPSAAHWLGTDALGRDVFTRILYGGRVTLYIGLLSVLLSMLIGVPIGLVAGYFGKLIDATLMRMLDLILAFPGLIFAIWLVSMLGPGVSQVIIANAVFSLPIFARLVRGNVMSVRHSDYVMAAYGLGMSHGRILFRHILPNVLPTIIVLASLNISSAMLTGAGLSYLGLGAQPPTPEWGAMLADGRPYLRDAWWVSLFPGLVLTLVVLASNIVGDTLRDALDPRSLRK